MDYIEQSLTGSEKVLAIGRFHWIYMATAAFWLGLGCVLFFGIIIGAVCFDIRAAMESAFPGLPADMFWQGWARVVENSGGYIAIIRNTSVAAKGGAFLSLLAGALMFAQMWVVRATTEIAVTTSRLVLKEGIIARRVDEMSVDRIESVHVLQSVLGRILDYGTVMVRGMGIGEIILPPLAKPVGFRNALEKARQIHNRENAA